MLSRFRIPARAAVLGGLAAAAVLASAPAQAQGRDAPLARFEDPLCPGVAGLRRDGAEAMVGRMRDNIEALGLALAPDGNCSANVVVAFVGDGADYLERLADDAEYLFASMDLDDRRQVLAQPGPARVLLQVLPRSRDGIPIPRREDLNEVPQTNMWMAHSRIYSATRNDIEYALVLIDRDDIAGVGVGQLADYATFRALTEALPQTAGPGAGSILTLFDSGETRPTGLTAFDRAYLATLYEGPPNLPGSTRLAELAQVTGIAALD